MMGMSSWSRVARFGLASVAVALLPSAQAARDSRILSIFSLSVTAVNGLMT